MRSSSARNTVPDKTLVIPNLAESQERDLAMRLSYLQRVWDQKLSQLSRSFSLKFPVRFAFRNGSLFCDSLQRRFFVYFLLTHKLLDAIADRNPRGLRLFP